VDVDVKSLLKTEFLQSMDPLLKDDGVSDGHFLDVTRRRAESKLVKFRIVNKVYNDEKLS
jgi:hypothetical protein